MHFKFKVIVYIAAFVNLDLIFKKFLAYKNTLHSLYTKVDGIKVGKKIREEEMLTLENAS